MAKRRSSAISKVLVVIGLCIGMAAAIVGFADNVPFVRGWFDKCEPWSSIGAALADLRALDTEVRGHTVGRVEPGDSGYAALLRVIGRHVDVTRYEPVLALFTQERGVRQTIAKRFEVADVYFGVVVGGERDQGELLVRSPDDEEAKYHLLGDVRVLESWVAEYRTRFYVSWALGLLFVSFLFQLLAAVVPAN